MMNSISKKVIFTLFLITSCATQTSDILSFNDLENYYGKGLRKISFNDNTYQVIIRDTSQNPISVSFNDGEGGLAGPTIQRDVSATAAIYCDYAYTFDKNDVLVNSLKLEYTCGFNEQ